MIAYDSEKVATEVATKLRDSNRLPVGMLQVLDYKSGACYLVGVSAAGALEPKALAVIAAHYRKSIDDIINAELRILCGSEYRPKPDRPEGSKKRVSIAV